MTLTHIKTCLIIVFAFLLTAQASAETEDIHQKYTQEHPLVYEDAWDLWPFAFINDEGESVGFNIDLVKAVMHRLDIPFVVRLKESHDAYNNLREGHSDLILGMYADYHDSYAHYGHSVVCLFTHSILSPKSHPTTMKKQDDLGKETVIVHDNSFSHNYLIGKGMGNKAIPYDDMKEAVIHVNACDSGQVLWNTLSLKWLKNHYKLDNLTLTPISMEHGEYRFMSNDTALLAKIDSVYTLMVINDEVQTLKNKWFYPEYKESGIPQWVWNIALMLAGLLGIAIVFHVFYRLQSLRIKENLEKQSKRLALYMESGNLTIWTYDIEASSFAIITPQGKKKSQIIHNSLGLDVLYINQDLKRIDHTIKRIKTGQISDETLMVTSKENGTTRYFQLSISILRTKDGHPSVLLGTQREMTTEYKQRSNTRNQLLRFSTIFNTSMADTAYFDKNGYLLDANNRTIQTLGITDWEGLLKARIHFNDIPPFCDIDLSQERVIHSSSIINFDELHAQNKLRFIHRRGMFYYQSVIIPIHDKNGQLDCFYCVGNDITEMVCTIQQERHQAQLISQATRHIQTYVDNINYVLEESDINVAHYDPKKKEIIITPNMNQPKLVLSQLRCLRMVDRSHWMRVIKVFEEMDSLQGKTVSLMLKTIFKEAGGIDQYMSFNAVPIYNKNGALDHYFALCRNMSQLMHTEKQMEQESAKAHEAEVIKNAFLKNMSYEIRTPLNAVIGFAELFDVEHAPEDEAIFVEEIKKNTNILLQLINDILFLSRLDAHMVEFKREVVDFVPLFASNLQMGWSKYLSQEVKVAIDCPYNKLMVDIDTEQVGRVVSHLAANAAHYTHQGTITAKTYYHSQNLYFTIDDTGSGISKEHLSRLFERFTENETGERRGSGLGLNICKELVEQMGGKIEVMSQLGKGTSVWVSIPCTIQEDLQFKEQPNNNQTTDEQKPELLNGIDLSTLSPEDLDNIDLSDIDLNSLMSNTDLFKS